MKTLQDQLKDYEGHKRFLVQTVIYDMDKGATEPELVGNLNSMATAEYASLDLLHHTNGIVARIDEYTAPCTHKLTEHVDDYAFCSRCGKDQTAKAVRES